MSRLFRGVRIVETQSSEDIRRFFDHLAEEYTDTHGRSSAHLRYRCRVIRKALVLGSAGRLLEIGCGTGDHILSLAGSAKRSIGVDFSRDMIRKAQERVPEGEHSIEFRVDDATSLSTVANCSIDTVCAVGCIEHVPAKSAVFRQAYRVLRQGGRFVCLTVNGGYFWYRRLAPLLRIETRHLSIDAFLDTKNAVALAREAGFEAVRSSYWSFVPKGDMPKWLGTAFGPADVVGRITRCGRLRGGLLIVATKPGRPGFPPPNHRRRLFR